MLSRFTTKTFLTSGSWTCPAGVTKIIVSGMGAGGSGGDAFTSSNFSGAGGCANVMANMVLNVVPNTTYTITIGEGTIPTTDGSQGNDTFFGALLVFNGAVGARFSTSYYKNHIGRAFISSVYSQYPSGGSASTSGSATPERGNFGRLGQSADVGTKLGSSAQGGNGGSGETGEDIGGYGGQAVTDTSGGNGGNAPDNSGAGGGGGAGASDAGGTSGIGGIGGSGKLIIMWLE